MNPNSCFIKVVHDIAEVSQVSAHPVDAVAHYVVARDRLLENPPSTWPASKALRPRTDGWVVHRHFAIFCNFGYNSSCVGFTLPHLVFVTESGFFRVSVRDARVKECMHG